MIKAPKTTSVNKVEYIPPLGAIAFTPELISLIKSGQKSSTFRYGLKYDHIEAGDVVSIVDSDTGKQEATVIIESKYKTKFCDLPLVFDKHEQYDNREHMRSVLSGYYAYLGRPLRDDDIFLVFEFELSKALNT